MKNTDFIGEEEIGQVLLMEVEVGSSLTMKSRWLLAVLIWLRA